MPAGERADDELREVGPIIAAGDVRELVDDDAIELGGREPRGDGRRHRDERRPEAEHRRTAHILGQHEP